MMGAPSSESLHCQSAIDHENGSRGIGPAFEMQYSPRFTLATSAEIEEMFTTHPQNAGSALRCTIIHLATVWVRK